MELKVSLSNKTLFLFLGLLSLLAILIVVNAYGGNTPSVMGHNLGEVGIADTNSNTIPDLADNIKSGCMMVNPQPTTAQATYAYTYTIPDVCKNQGCYIIGDATNLPNGGYNVLYYKQFSSQWANNGAMYTSHNGQWYSQQLNSTVYRVGKNGDTTYTQIMGIPGIGPSFGLGYIYDDGAAQAPDTVNNPGETNINYWFTPSTAPPVLQICW